MMTVLRDKKLEALSDWFNNPQLHFRQQTENTPELYVVDDLRIHGLHAVPVIVVHTQEQDAVDGKQIAAAYKKRSEIKHRDGTEFIVYHDFPNK